MQEIYDLIIVSGRKDIRKMWVEA